MRGQSSTWAPALAQVRRAWLTSPLPGFLAWWGAELRGLLPARLVEWCSRQTSWCLLEMDEQQAVLRHVDSDSVLARIDMTQAQALQQAAWQEAMVGLDSHDVRIALCLAEHQVLRRRLRLPAAARADLRHVIGYEMDRQTPFRADAVCFDVRLIEPARDGQLEVELVLVPKAHVQPLLQRAQAMGVQVDAVDMAVSGGRLGMNLLEVAARPRHRNPRRQLNLALAGLACVWLLLLMGQWLHNRHDVLMDMQTRVQALRAQAHEVAALRNQWTAQLDAAGFLARRRTHAPTMLAVITDVTHRLPDDTWLKRFSVGADDEVTLQGQSPHATELLKRLTGSAYVLDPGFRGSIQTDPGTGKENFVISARLRTKSPGGQSNPATHAAKPVTTATRQRSTHAPSHAH